MFHDPLGVEGQPTYSAVWPEYYSIGLTMYHWEEYNMVQEIDKLSSS